jgi:hypothetical protein
MIKPIGGRLLGGGLLGGGLVGGGKGSNSGRSLVVVNLLSIRKGFARNIE